ncbi:hypothetical protein PB01_08505 [Psychrobacillus glaciei]|uniref:Phenylalanyl-tRNA synthetase subunit beta n=1 Tax=Psychrobacillus glaciei TaxID=2283160 RepID=A0A5J6SLJ6_9BACI|nr:hypothetical protein [Psychrobacillus glaciei]QFF98870.1 hypothetical protein PB01_08505 [Psychrobacillus glaciei]
MKFLKVLFGFVFVIALIGFAAYYFVPKLVADQVMEKVAVELQDSGQLESIKKEINSDPQLQAFIEEGKNVDNSKLPFQTKEEATRLLIKKFKISDLKEFQEKAQSGITEEDKQEIFNKLENNLTTEEMLALKVLAYKELSK